MMFYLTYCNRNKNLAWVHVAYNVQVTQTNEVTMQYLHSIKYEMIIHLWQYNLINILIMLYIQQHSMITVKWQGIFKIFHTPTAAAFVIRNRTLHSLTLHNSNGFVVSQNTRGTS